MGFQWGPLWPCPCLRLPSVINITTDEITRLVLTEKTQHSDRLMYRHEMLQWKIILYIYFFFLKTQPGKLNQMYYEHLFTIAERNCTLMSSGPKLWTAFKNSKWDLVRLLDQVSWLVIEKCAIIGNAWNLQYWSWVVGRDLCAAPDYLVKDAFSSEKNTLWSHSNSLSFLSKVHL